MVNTQNNKLTTTEEIEVLCTLRNVIKRDRDFVEKYSKDKEFKELIKDTQKTIKSLKSAYSKLVGYKYEEDLE